MAVQLPRRSLRLTIGGVPIQDCTHFTGVVVRLKGENFQACCRTLEALSASPEMLQTTVDRVSRLRSACTTQQQGLIRKQVKLIAGLHP